MPQTVLSRETLPFVTIISCPLCRKSAHLVERLPDPNGTAGDELRRFACEGCGAKTQIRTAEC